MEIGDIVGAFRTPDGIELRKIKAIDGNSVAMSVNEVLPGDPDWLSALAALPPEDVAPAEPVEEPLDWLKTAAVQGVLRVAGEVRKYFVSDMPGQDMVYLRKEEEARKWVNGTDPNITNFPFLQAEVGITAPDPYQLSQIWLYMAESWLGIASQIEHYRFAAVGAIQAATTASEIQTIVSNFNQVMSMFR